MKLSQIKLLSWSASTILSLACAAHITSTISSQDGRRAPDSGQWSPEEPDIPNKKKLRLVSNQNLMSALSFITKVEPPPVSITPEPVEEMVEAPPVEKKFDFGYELVLVSYDEKHGRHLAFLSKERKGMHPYLLGAFLDCFPVAELVEIHRDHVVLKADDGRKQLLSLEKESSDRVTSRATVSSSPKRSRPALPPPTQASTPKVAPPPKPQKRQRRTVPKWRNVHVDPNFGINVVKYSPDSEGNERYAISQKDLGKLTEQSLKLLSEMAPSMSYDEQGEPNGILLNFVVDEPLAKNYGIREGDILTEINGEKVQDESDVQRIYDSLGPNDRSVTSTIQRGDSKVKVILEMDDFPATPQKK